jgi:hypothetical protein
MTSILCQKKVILEGTNDMANTYCMKTAGHEGKCEPDYVVVRIPKEQAVFLRMFLDQAVDGMKQACTLKEAEDTAVQAIFISVKTLIDQLPKGDV